MKDKYKRCIIKYGKIQDHYLVDFPQHILLEKNNMYSVEINGGGFTFRLSNVPANYEFRLPLANVNQNDYQYNFTISWGDGSQIDEIKSFDDEHNSHIYAKSGTYNVIIFDKDFSFNNNAACYGFNNKACFDSYNKNYWEYLTDILDWGNIDLFSLNYRIL